MRENAWIEHDGGECPVADDARVVVKLRRYGEQPECFADTVAWKHSPVSANDIIAYRLSGPSA